MRTLSEATEVRNDEKTMSDNDIHSSVRVSLSLYNINNVKRDVEDLPRHYLKVLQLSPPVLSNVLADLRGIQLRCTREEFPRQ